VLRSYGIPPADAEDVVQGVFLGVVAQKWHSIQLFEEEVMKAIRSKPQGKTLQKREADETEARKLYELADDAAEGYRTFLYALSGLVLGMPHLEQSTISPNTPFSPSPSQGEGPGVRVGRGRGFGPPQNRARKPR
jgi:hypothetical protein